MIFQNNKFMIIKLYFTNLLFKKMYDEIENVYGERYVDKSITLCVNDV